MAKDPYADVRKEFTQVLEHVGEVAAPSDQYLEVLEELAGELEIYINAAKCDVLNGE